MTSPAIAEKTTEQPLDIYESGLRAILEPLHNGQYVAIHPSTGDHVLARGPGKAHRAMRARQPEGRIILRRIGTADSGLQARILGESRH